MDLIESLDHTFTHAHGVIAQVRRDQYSSPTPCEEWTVSDLLEHMIGVVAGIGAAAAGSPPAGAAFELDPEPAQQFQKVAGAALEAWRAPGVLDRVIDGAAGPMPGRVLAGINLLDTTTHTWDLAVATGQPATLPEGLAAATLDRCSEIITPELRPGRFGPELEPPPGADATGRLVAFLGRQA
ncbi:MAG: TIGR03086 family metal-binding protein [Actinomycetota bacterium]|nr:TIGR03086 family metal-binding protein [Actinomycetota bacterium]